MIFCSTVPVLQLWFPNALHYCLISTYLLTYLYCWWTAQRFYFMCQVSSDGWEEEAGGSHCSARRRAGRGARQHGAAEWPLQKDHYAGVMEGIKMTCLPQGLLPLLFWQSHPIWPSGGDSDHRFEYRAQLSTKEWKCSPTTGAPKQGAESQTGWAGGLCEEQVQGFHHCSGSQDSTTGGAAGAGGQVRLHFTR